MTHFQTIHPVCQKFPDNDEFGSIREAALKGKVFEPPFLHFKMSFSDFFLNFVLINHDVNFGVHLTEQ